MEKEAVEKWINELFQTILNYIPENYRIPISLIVFILLIFLYAIFIWEFYKFLAKRDILELNLKKYNFYLDSGWRKFLAVLVYCFEFLIIIPFFIFFWFAVFSLFMLVLSKGRELESILLISTAVVGAIRISAYYSENLSEDLAKMIPFTMLCIFLFDPNFFSFSNVLDRFFQIPALLSMVFVYMVSLFLLEMVLRLTYTVVDAFSDENDEIIKKKDN